jgi:proline racemase
MLLGRTITVVGCHAGGEVGNVVVEGVAPPPGDTVFEQMQALRRDDSLRRFLLREPRGSVATHANLIVPATAQTARRATSSWSRPSTR